jgi:putative oxidoreductase
MQASDVSLLILRLTAAIVLWPHGAQKALGWFGGPGIAATVAGMSSHFGLPPAILLVLGILTRVAALGIAIDMAVAAVLAHAANGFFMNFSDKQAGEGVEYFILLVGIGLTLTIAGPGRIAFLKRF